MLSIQRAALMQAAPAGFDPSLPLAFMHIPKTAGTSLLCALQASLRPQRSVLGFDRVLFGSFTDFDSLHASCLSLIHRDADALPDADFVGGHMGFSTLHRRANAQLITILREPASRLLSLWLYWRGQSREQLTPWGSWAERVRQSHLPLVDFLRSPRIACQTDNIVVRMLLWPHELVCADSFIRPRHDAQLLALAVGRLRRFAHVDVAENPDLSRRLQDWLGRPVAMRTHNETNSIPLARRSPLDRELTPEALDLLQLRSRLDLQLWRDIVRPCLPGRDPDQLRQKTMLRNVVRYAALMTAA